MPTPIDPLVLLEETKCYACMGASIPELFELGLLNRILTPSAAPTGPIVELGLGTDFSAISATSYTTAVVFTPATNALLLATVVSGTPGVTPPATPTVTGCGLTWVVVQSIGGPAGTGRVSVFRALGAATNGSLTVDFAGVSQSGYVISLRQYTQVNTSGTNGSGAIVQSGTSGPITGTSLTVTLAAFNANALNAGFIAISRNANPVAVTPEAGWTQDAQQAFTNGNSYGLWNSHRLLCTDNTPSGTFGFSGSVVGIGLEIKSASS